MLMLFMVVSFLQKTESNRKLVHVVYYTPLMLIGKSLFTQLFRGPDSTDSAVAALSAML